MIRDEKGIAMVLAITLVGLMASLGLYLILGSDASFRMTKAMNRYESAFNLAEGGVQLGLGCVRHNAPAPTFNQIMGGGPLPSTFPAAELPAYMQYPVAIPGSPGTISNFLDYLGYRTTPPPGWMLNRQGAGKFHGIFYRPRTEGRIVLPTKGTGSVGNNDALCVNTLIPLKVQR